MPMVYLGAIADAYLDQVLALRLGDQRLELRGGKGVDETSFGDDKKQDLCASQDTQFVCLYVGELTSVTLLTREVDASGSTLVLENSPSS